MSGHGIVKCVSCDGVIQQCRCPGPHDVTYSTCDSCKKQAVGFNTGERRFLFIRADGFKQNIALDAELAKRDVIQRPDPPPLAALQLGDGTSAAAPAYPRTFRRTTLMVPIYVEEGMTEAEVLEALKQ